MADILILEGKMQGILIDNTKLKNLILENPDLPLLVFATDEANSGEYCAELASCRCEKGIVLDATKDCWLPCDDRIYTDEDDLQEDISDALCDDWGHLSDAEFDDLVEEKTKALKPYWKDCIVIYVDAF